MSINPLANRPRADARGFGNGLRRLSARDLPYNAFSTARRQPGILMHVHPVLPWNLKLQQPQLPRSEPDGQPTESSQLAMNWRRGLFRLWIVGAALFVIAVAAVSYSDIKAELDAASIFEVKLPD